MNHQTRGKGKRKLIVRGLTESVTAMVSANSLKIDSGSPCPLEIEKLEI